MTPRAATTATRRRDEVANALRRLDDRLDAALAAFDAAQGGPTRDRFRGLVISPDEPRRLLERGPNSPALAQASRPAPLWRQARGSLAHQLAATFGLSAFDLDVLLIAVAPELDLRYERIYAYLQDDVSRKRPTVDLILGLLCDGEADRLSRRLVFDNGAPLVCHELITVADPQQAFAPLLARPVVPDNQVVRLLLGQSGMDERLTGVCRVETPAVRLDDLVVPHDVAQALAALSEGIRARARVAAWLTAPAGAGKQEAAGAMADAAGLPLLVLDATSVPSAEVGPTLGRAMRDAACRPALLHVTRAESWLGDDHAVSVLVDALRAPRCAVVFGSAQPMPARLRGLACALAIPLPDRAGAAACWRRALGARGVTIDAPTVAGLADRFRLTPGQVASAIDDAMQRSRWCTPADTARTPLAVASGHLFAAARAQSGDALGAVATKVEARAGWDDLVLPADAMAQLRELCERVDGHARVFDDWGFARRSARGRGTAALFSGGSGTGKTMAAEVIATALGLDLYRIDLSRVVSKYIGETEKHLDRVFTAAQAANAILFFDEADALFGKRSEVKDAHDRYANIEVSYLLQKMEEYDGLAILATNLANHLDQAFTRRLAAHVYFPFPDAAARLEIWKRAWPREVPIAADLDLAAIARDLKVSGGNIRNIALAAAFLAAGNGGVVGRAHVVHAVRREHQKDGRASELGVAFNTIAAPALAAVEG